MNKDKQFLKLCKALDKATNKWGDGLTYADNIAACLTIAAYLFEESHNGKPSCATSLANHPAPHHVSTFTAECFVAFAVKT